MADYQPPTSPPATPFALGSDPAAQATEVATAKEDTVATPSVWYGSMASKWAMIHALIGGTEAMRAAGQTYLPREPKETDEQYTCRVERTFLNPAYKDTVERIVSKPFAEPVTLQGGDNLDQRLKDIEDDVDKTGRDLTTACRESFEDGVKYGIIHTLVDFPQMPMGATKEDEAKANARPMFVRVCPPNLIGARWTQGSGGEPELEQIRIAETRIEPVGTYIDKVTRYVRVINRDTWEVWEYVESSGTKGEWVKKTNGINTFKRVPLVTCYFNRTGFMTADPPLEDLAWLNVEHWQKSSDQNACLKFGRLGILFGKGFPEEWTEQKTITIGPQRAILLSDIQADLKYVEQQGTGLEAGRLDLKDIEERMEVLGVQPFIEKTQTATVGLIDESRATSDVKAWVRLLENHYVKCYQTGGEWISAEVPDDFKVDINTDIELVIRASEDVKNLLTMRAAGEIDQETFLREIKKRGTISEGTEVKDIIERLGLEGPPEPVTPEVPPVAPDQSPTT